MRKIRRAKAGDRLSQVLASGALRAVVLYLATHEEESPAVRGIARATGLGLGSVEIEMARLVRLRVIERMDGRYALRLREPLWVALRGLARAVAPAVDVMRVAMADVSGIDEAFVFGSTAGGDARVDSDVDLLVVGRPDERAFARRTLDAGVLLGREVNPVLVSPDQWAAKEGAVRGFWANVQAGPKQWVVRDGTPLRVARVYAADESAVA
jgi:predicted nucleotidyltransferase